MLKRTALGHWVIEGDYGVSRLVLEAGTFEYPENLRVLSNVAHLIPEGGVVVDAGASLGDQTVLYSQIVGASGQVYAFEPHRESYDALVKNTDRFRNVTPINAALGAMPDDAALFSISPTNLGASFLGTMAEYPTFPTTHVRITTLDLALADVPHVDFIHLDAEGMETAILHGAAAVIADDQPVLLIEVTPQWLARYGSSQAQLYAQLEQMGYPTLVPMQDNPYWFDVLAVPVARTVSV